MGSREISGKFSLPRFPPFFASIRGVAKVTRESRGSGPTATVDRKVVKTCPSRARLTLERHVSKFLRARWRISQVTRVAGKSKQVLYTARNKCRLLSIGKKYRSLFHFFEVRATNALFIRVTRIPLGIRLCRLAYETSRKICTEWQNAQFSRASV